MEYIYNLLQLFAFFFYLCLGLFMLQRGKDKSKYSFVILCLGLSLFSFGHFNLFTPGMPESMALFWMRISIIGLAFVLPGYLHFVALLIGYTSLLKHKLYYWAYIVSAGFILPLTLSHKSFQVYNWGYYPIFNPMVSIYHLFLLFLLAETVYLLYSGSKKIREKIGDKMLRYLMLGGICTVILVVFNMLPVYKIKIYPAGNIIVFPYVLFLSYLILKYQLIPITIIKKREAYSITAGFLMFLLVYGVLYIDYFLKISWHNSLWPTIILGLIMVMVFKSLHSRINKIIDYIFFRKAYMHTLALQDFTRSLSSTLTREVLLHSMLGTLERILDTNIIFIMTIEDKHYKIIQSVGLDEKTVHSMSFSYSHPIVTILKEEKAILLLNEVRDENLRRYFEKTQAVIFLPIIYQDSLPGIIGIGRKRCGDYNDNDLLWLSNFSLSASLGMVNTGLYEERTRHLYEGIKILVQTLEAKDTYTHGHCERVADISHLIGCQLNLSETQLEDLKMASILHDIGKIGVSKQVLNKPGFLTQKEFMEIKEHPSIGGKIVESICFPADVHNGIKLHHERFDGKGYPEGRENKDCPLIARIIQVADAYEAMTSNRPYRQAMTQEAAMEELNRGKAKQFDPYIVEAFLKATGESDL
ncbi:hypothetical protein COZ13_08870 [Candidatus Desantisbacteria bacterium CG_4_10_14_3_um_filter_40_18]|uniref:Uncharacterized protein n=1 Tax=Candidatus Desantisbacteria bacterium CG_4_10_14_3_um_filter_40_18 TaxID=1974544 RepID=A0A2M7P0G4_9BACT|nr:MAG: hypothetical protein COZ13_08870 [Candidatus Desantisbacteria bacterium CG_4_10_14_3_um_filter_40_18]